MIATDDNLCLSLEQMQCLVDGNLATGDAADDLTAAIDHLDRCRSCQAKIESLSTSKPSPSAASAVSSPQDKIHQETACGIAISRLVAKPFDNVVRSSDSVDSVNEQQSLGPYRLVRPLGAGGMGTVYLAEHERLRRMCAIKILPRHRINQAGWLDRFEREMVAIASLEHPNIIRATDAGSHEDWHYLVMDFADGLDVGSIARRCGTVNVAEASAIIHSVAAALAHIHEARLVHRDIKPSNVMLCRNGSVKLLDLGLVLDGDDPLGMDDRLTTAGHLMGTLPYMAPEQLIDSRKVTPSSDIYALGATFFRLLTGKLPHPPKRGLAKQITSITNTDAPKLAEVDPSIEPDVSELVAAMLDRDPEQRPTAQNVVERLIASSRSADLKELVKRATALLDDGDVHATSQFDPGSVLSRSALLTESPARRFPAWWYVIGLGMFAFGGWLMGTMIKIKTDRGEITVKTDSDDVAIDITSDDSPTDSQPSSQITYEGKTFEQWMTIAETEKAEVLQYDATRAAALLSKNDKAKQERLGRAIRSNMLVSLGYASNRRYEDLFLTGPQRQLRGITRTIEMIFNWDRDVRMDFIVSLLESSNHDESYTGMKLIEHSMVSDDSAWKLSAEAVARITKLLPGLVERFNQQHLPTAHWLRATAIHFAVAHASPNDDGVWPAWMEETVKLEVKNALEKYEALSDDTGRNGRFPLLYQPAKSTQSWIVLEPATLQIALQMQRQGKLDLDGDFVVAEISSPRFAWFDVSEPGNLLAAVTETLPSTDAKMQDAIVTLLNRYNFDHFKQVPLMHRGKLEGDMRTVNDSPTVKLLDQWIRTSSAGRQTEPDFVRAMNRFDEMLNQYSSNILVQLRQVFSRIRRDLDIPSRAALEQDSHPMQVVTSSTSNESIRLYQGKNFDQWIEQAQVDVEVRTVGTALLAASKLAVANTAENSGVGLSQQAKVAKIGLDRSSQWGGYSRSSVTDQPSNFGFNPSLLFMAFLADSFEPLDPQVQLAAIGNAIESDQAKQQRAALAVLELFYYGEGDLVDRNRAFLNSEDADDQSTIVELIRTLIPLAQSDDAEARIESYGQRIIEAELMKAVSLGSISLRDEDAALIRQIAIDQIKSKDAAYQSKVQKNDVYGNPIKITLDFAALMAAVELHREGALNLDPDFAADTFESIHVIQKDLSQIKKVAALSDAHEASVVKKIAEIINVFSAKTIEKQSSGSGMFGMNDSAQEYIAFEDQWLALINFYAESGLAEKRSIADLNKIYTQLEARNSVEVDLPLLRKAIEKVSSTIKDESSSSDQ